MEERKMFADRLLELRTENCFTMKEAAQLIGVSESTYHNWEKGGKFPRPDAIRKIALAYGVKARWLEVGLGAKTETEERKAKEDAIKLADDTIVMKAEDRRKLDVINMTIKYLPSMECKLEEKKQIFKLLSDFRADYEAKMLFGSNNA